MPFEVFKQDKDEVIMLINFMIEKGEETTGKMNVVNKKGQTVERIRVNDKTATGGWW